MEENVYVETAEWVGRGAPGCSLSPCTLPRARDKAQGTYCQEQPINSKAAINGNGVGQGLNAEGEKKGVNPLSLPPDRGPSQRPATSHHPITDHHLRPQLGPSRLRNLQELNACALRRPAASGPSPAPRRLPDQTETGPAPPHAASRRSRASNPRSGGRLLPGPGRGHHLAPSLRDHTSRRLASAANLETFLQIGAPLASSELASV